jgi:hypothetical protein
MIHGQGHQRLGILSGGGRLTAMLAHVRRTIEGQGDTLGVGKFLRPCEGLLASCQCLLWITQRRGGHDGRQAAGDYGELSLAQNGCGPR